jgi:hypothetical protein
LNIRRAAGMTTQVRTEDGRSFWNLTDVSWEAITTKSPRPTFRSSRDKSGDGSSPSSLSRAGIRRLIGCRLPDAILHGKRSLRPRSRAVQSLATSEFRVRLFSLLGLMVAPPACKPGQDTSAISFPRLDHFAQGQPPLLTARSPEPRVSPLHSQVAFRLQSSGAFFDIAGLWKVFTRPAKTSCPSRIKCSLCPAFRRLSLSRVSFKKHARVIRSVLVHSSNRLPFG